MFLRLRDTLVAFNETRGPTSRNVLLNKVYWCQIDQKHVKRLGSLLGFPFKKTS